MDIKKTLEKAVQTLQSEKLNLANGVIAVGSPEAGAVLGAISFIKKLKRWIIIGLISVATAVISLITVVNNHANLIMEQYTSLNNRTSDSKQSYEKPVLFMTVQKDGKTKVEVVYSNTVKDQFLGAYSDIQLEGNSMVVESNGSTYIDDTSEVAGMTKQQFMSALNNLDYNKETLELAYDVLYDVFGGDMNAVIAFIGNFMGEGDIGLVQGGMTLKNWNGDGKDVKTGYTYGVDRTYVRSAANIAALRSHLASVGENNHIGVGVAQWTYYSRLAGLLDLYEKYTKDTADNSAEFIAGIERAEREYLKKELNSYKGDIISYAQGKSTTTVDGVSRSMQSWRADTEPNSMEAYVISAVNVYEKPARRAAAIQKRVTFAQDIYKTLKDYMENG